MRKLFGKRAAALVLAVMVVLPCGTFAFAAGGANAAGTKEAAAAADSAAIVTLGEAKNLQKPQAPKEKPAVMFNGEYIDFTDAKPVNINGRVMVPFRAIFETMGADVNYDGKSKEITAALGSKSISFKAGSSELTVNTDGRTEKITMDAVPFTDAYTKRTYVSSRFAAEAFGYSVGWDHANKTVVIIDFTPVIKEVSEKMTIIGLMFDANKVDVLRPYSTSGDLDLDMTIGSEAMKALKGETADTKPLHVKIGGKVDGTVQGKSGITNDMTADIKMALELNEKDLIKALEISDTAQGNLWELILSDLSMEIKMDGENMYIKAPALDYLMLGQSGEGYSNQGTLQGTAGGSALAASGKDVWYKMPMSLIFDTYESMGIDYERIFSAAQSVSSFEGYLNMLALMFTEVGEPDIDTYYALRVGASVLNALIGDAAFTTTGSGSAKTHTLNFDMNSFMELAKIVDEEDAAREIMSSLSEEGIDFTINLTIQERNNALDKYTLKINVSGDDKFAFTLDDSGNLLNETAKFTLKINNYLDISLKANSRTQNTSKVPDVTLPQTAKIVDFAEMMQGGSAEMMQ